MRQASTDIIGWEDGEKERAGRAAEGAGRFGGSRGAGGELSREGGTGRIVIARQLIAFIGSQTRIGFVWESPPGRTGGGSPEHGLRSPWARGSRLRLVWHSSFLGSFGQLRSEATSGQPEEGAPTESVAPRGTRKFVNSGAGLRPHSRGAALRLALNSWRTRDYVRANGSRAADEESRFIVQRVNSATGPVRKYRPQRLYCVWEGDPFRRKMQIRMRSIARRSSSSDQRSNGSHEPTKLTRKSDGI